MSNETILQGPTFGPANGENAKKLVILLHGLGANGADLIGLAPFLSDVLPTSTGHDNITVYFIDLIQQDTVATSFTDTYGAYTASIPAGFYLVKWLKYGYIPQELGNYALSSDTTFNDIILSPGFIQNVCGNVSGTWASGNVYHVDCDITIPLGDSLTIESGVIVRFAAGTKLTANGKLKILGTSSDRVSFTSLSPSPLPGDWDNVILNSPNNIINHLDYDYATNGFTGTSASGTTMDSLRMVGTLSLTANGVYLENTTNLSIDNSVISVAGSYGLYAQNANNSSITNSTIDGTYSEAAIKMESCIGCVVNNNTISNKPNYGVWMDYGLNIVITNNTGSFVSIIHVGWKGLYNNFISTFISSISINPNSCIAWIGPSISQKFYSVDKLFYKCFVSKNKEYGKFFIKVKGKYYFSLQDSAIYQFNRAQVKQVFVSNLCTYDNNNLFFSYRKNKTLMRFPTLAWIE